MASERPPEFLPVVVSIDCEPDRRVTPAAGPPSWDGMEGIIEMIACWREPLPGARVGWYWRADEQVRRGHGDPGWALRHFRDHIDTTSALGDEHGLHPHLWRWSEPEGDWMSDAADDEWAEHCIRTSVDAFVRALDCPVRAVRMGDGHMSARILATLERAGIECDLTLEPGAAPVPSLVPSERATGMTPDRRATPRVPFRPSLHQPCEPGPARGTRQLWALPLTTAPAGLAGITPGTAANLGFPPEMFRRIVQRGLGESLRQGAPYLAVVVRSDVGQDLGLARHTAANLAWLSGGGAGLAPPRFIDPIEALQILTATGPAAGPAPTV